MNAKVKQVNQVKGVNAGRLGVGDNYHWLATAETVDMAMPAPAPIPVEIATKPQSVIIDLRRTAILVIDMQNDFCAQGGWVDYLGAYATQSPMLGLIIGIATVMPIALLQAFLSNTLRANQIVTGIGINILVLGATTLAYREIFGARSRATFPGLEKWTPPLLGDIPIFGEAVFQQAWVFYLAIVIIAMLAIAFAYTSLGLSIIAAGADPRALHNSGVSVNKVRYGAVMFTGLMAALGGCFLSIGDIHTFTEGMTNGAGYLAIAAVIFGNWKISRTVLACLLFGSATALQFQLPAMGVQIPTALLVMLPYVLALLAVAGLAGRQTAPPALTQPYRGGS